MIDYDDDGDHDDDDDDDDDYDKTLNEKMMLIGAEKILPLLVVGTLPAV